MLIELERYGGLIKLASCKAGQHSRGVNIETRTHTLTM